MEYCSRQHMVMSTNCLTDGELRLRSAKIFKYFGVQCSSLVGCMFKALGLNTSAGGKGVYVSDIFNLIFP